MTRAAKRYDIPLGVLYAVGLTETGKRGSLQPFAMNIEGRAHYSANLADAVADFQAARGEGAVLIDIGCMQINHHYHGEAFASVAAMFDPRRNVDYAAPFLKQLKAREGSWTHGRRALSRRTEQQSGAEALRLQRDRQHGRDRLWRMDSGCAPLLRLNAALPSSCVTTRGRKRPARFSLSFKFILECRVSITAVVSIKNG